MTVRILHYYTSQGSYAELGRLTALNRAAYCERHGYELKVDLSDYSEGFPDKRFLHNTKFSSVAANLDGCDYLVWMDADIIVANPDIRIEEFFTDKSVTHPHYRDDGSDCDLHNGLIVFRNDRISRFYLDMCRDPWMVAGTQARFPQMFVLDEEISNYVVSTIPTLRNHVGRIEFAKVYSNVPGVGKIAECDILKSFEPGDFILHLSNPLPQRLKIHYARKYVDLCERLGCGHAMPVELVSKHIKELGLNHD